MTQDVKETEAYFRSLKEMLRSEGWSNLMKELDATAQRVNSVEFTKDSEDLNYRKGQLNILATLLNLENQIEQAEEQFKREQDESPE